jgi:hypothetical protein
MNLIETVFDFNSVAYKEKEIEFKEDPLVLACSIQDLVNKTANFYSLEDCRVIENITQEIRDHAEAVRKHYAQKFFWANLNNQKLSPIRTRMASLLEGRIRTCSENDRGIYYKLPFFYEEDMIYEEFKKLYNTEKLSPLGNKRSNAFAKRLTFIKTSNGIQKNRKQKYFWFSDDNKDLYCIQVDIKNNLIDMLEGFLEQNPTPLFHTYLTEDRLDKLHFYKLYSFKFLKDHNA